MKLTLIVVAVATIVSSANAAVACAWSDMGNVVFRAFS